MITISLFFCCEKAFILMNVWMVGKNSMKHYLKKNIFYAQAKRVCKEFEMKNVGEYHDVYVHDLNMLYT